MSENNTIHTLLYNFFTFPQFSYLSIIFLNFRKSFRPLESCLDEYENKQYENK